MVLSEALQKVLCQCLPGERCLGMCSSRNRALLERWLGLCRVQHAGYRPDRLRRGGATEMPRLAGILDQTALRGKWANHRIARICINDGVLKHSEIQRMPDQRTALKRFGDVWVGRQ